jgi:hypothetical protein
MKKKSLYAVVAVFVLWSLMDFLLHGVLLSDLYAATASLWRPPSEMRHGLLHVVRLISALCYVGIYACLVSEKSMGRALRYGVLYGVAAGVGMGYGSYAVMPIPYYLALAWFLGAVAEALAGAVILGLVLTESPKRA